VKLQNAAKILEKYQKYQKKRHLNAVFSFSPFILITIVNTARAFAVAFMAAAA